MEANEALLNLVGSIDILADDEDKTLAKEYGADEKGLELVRAVMAEGIIFSKPVAMHWAIEICGSFEVTHKDYEQPVGINTPAGSALADFIHSLVEEGL